uniref:Uncharacterized protein n=1 Tax=Arundo donax TaxID=35708 RepID=A0A0A9F3N6_ARUDO
MNLDLVYVLLVFCLFVCCSPFVIASIVLALSRIFLGLRSL